MDDFMICGGIFSELWSILHISGVSNKTFELINMLSTVIGHSSVINAPFADAVQEAAF